jgi:rhamnosyltransferase
MIFAVVVTYNPKSPPTELCALLGTQCRVLIVDNSTDQDCVAQLQFWACSNNYDHAWMNGNVGIAAAQNAGLEFARRFGASGLVFFDQDSLIDSSALTFLVNAVKHGERAVYSLIPGDRSSTTDIRTFGLRELMSSGSGCKLDIFDAVGPFEAGLFIDCVDFEWGWRCLRHGVPILALEGGVFQHTLGKSRVSVLGFKAHIDSPIRLYYQFRNITQMIYRDYVPLGWKCSQILRSSAKVLLMLLIARQRRLRIKLAAQGVADGLRGRLGPYLDGERR